LTEAIALGHDLGHTPFGHVGEEVLNELCPDGFRHNEQSLRVVDLLEKYGSGLNLTWEVRDGILNHSKGDINIFGEGWSEVGSVEGQVVKISDIVAYINHDTSDALRAGVITNKELPGLTIKCLGNSSSQRINTLVSDIVYHTLSAIENTNQEKPTVGMSPEILQAANELREFLFDKVYNSNLARTEKEEAKAVVRDLYRYFCKHPEELPEEYNHRYDSLERKVTDYVAGMTDRYACRMTEKVSPKTGKFINAHL